MADRRMGTQHRTFNADNLARCPLCQKWFDRSDQVRLAEHRGALPHPVPHPKTAWADEDDEGPDRPTDFD
jgi:hypothetical protein